MGWAPWGGAGDQLVEAGLARLPAGLPGKAWLVCPSELVHSPRMTVTYL